MSEAFPIIAITGSSGSGSRQVGDIFDHIAWRLKIRHLLVDGSAFHRYTRGEMLQQHNGGTSCENLTHFSPQGNMLERLRDLLVQFGEAGGGSYRHYLHTETQAREAGQDIGTFTPWQSIPRGVDLLVYQGLHGAYKDDTIDIPSLADLSIGVAPIVNLEWIQKIHTDIRDRGYTLDQVREIIEQRLHDYVHYITPQFSRTDINFQRIPLVDTSNPFIARDVPSADETMVVIRFRDPSSQDFPYLVRMIKGACMSRRNTLVVPGGRMDYAMELLLNPLVEQLIERRRRAIAC